MHAKPIRLAVLRLNVSQRGVATMAIALISSLLISSTGWSALVSSEATESGLGFDSVAPNYDYRATGFNPQTQITRDNVKFLELKWLFPWPDSEGIRGITPRIGSISQPLIVDGIVYGRAENLRIFAIDAKTGGKDLGLSTSKFSCRH